MSKYRVVTMHKQEADPAPALLKELGADVFGEKTLGKRTLAYPVKKELSGYYSATNFMAEATTLGTLTNALKQSDGVLRSVILRYYPEPAARVDARLKPAPEKITAPKETAATESARKAKLEEKLQELLQE